MAANASRSRWRWRKRRGVVWAAAALGLAALAVTPAADRAEPVRLGGATAMAQTAEAPALRGADQEVMMELHHANENVIAMARMAEQKAASPEVRDLGATIARERGAADERVVALGLRRGMDPVKLSRPYDASAHGELVFVKLRAFSGAAFDREFTT